jgi:hypothetical protein
VRILAYLIQTFLDPLGVVLGLVTGALARRAWQAGWGGALVGAVAILVKAHLDQSAIQLRPAVTGAIVSAAWALLAFWLRRWLRGSR